MKIVILILSIFIGVISFSLGWMFQENRIVSDKLNLKSDSLQIVIEQRLNYMLTTIRLSEICDENQSSRNLKDNDSLYLHLIDKIN